MTAGVGVWGSGSWGEGDGVAECFELADVVAFDRVRVVWRVKWSGPGSVKRASSVSRCQTITSSERPMATTARFLPRRRAMRQ